MARDLLRCVQIWSVGQASTLISSSNFSSRTSHREFHSHQAFKRILVKNMSNPPKLCLVDTITFGFKLFALRRVSSTLLMALNLQRSMFAKPPPPSPATHVSSGDTLFFGGNFNSTVGMKKEDILLPTTYGSVMAVCHAALTYPDLPPPVTQPPLVPPQGWTSAMCLS